MLNAIGMAFSKTKDDKVGDQLERLARRPQKKRLSRVDNDERRKAFLEKYPHFKKRGDLTPKNKR